MRKMPRAKLGTKNRSDVVEAMERRMLMSAGVFNPAFGGTGFVTTPVTSLGTNFAVGPSGGVAALSDGSMVVAGTKPEITPGGITGDVYRPELVKIKSNGTVDTSFGTNDVATAVLMDGTTAINVLVSQLLAAPGGKILVVGTAFGIPGEGFNERYVAERFNADGSFDTTFNSVPLLNYMFGKSGPNESDAATSGAILPNGKIILVGLSGNGSKFNLGVVRLNADGTIDTTFGFQNSGARLVLGEGTVSAAVAIDSAGRIVIGGAALSNFSQIPVTGGRLEVERLTPSGGIDTSFGTDGLAISNPFGGQVFGYGVGVQPDGTIIVAGTDSILSSTGPNLAPGYYATAAFSTTGAIKTSYGTGGSFQIQVGNPSPLSYAMQADGKSLLISRQFATNSNLGPFAQELKLVRLTTAGKLDPTFAGGGNEDLVLPGGNQDVTGSMVFAPDSSGGKIDLMLIGSQGNPIPLAAGQLTDDVTATALPTPFTGTVIGTTGSYRNQGNMAINAFDGNLSTFFDGPTASGNFVGLDLGTAKVVTMISFAPRAGFASRMVGGVFQASNSATFSSGVTTLYTITAAPTAGTLTTVTLSNASAFRYVRYLSLANSYGNIAELVFAG